MPGVTNITGKLKGITLTKVLDESMQVLLIKDKLLINYLSFFAFAKLIVFLRSEIGLDYFFRYFIDCLKLIVLSIATGV